MPGARLDPDGIMIPTAAMAGKGLYNRYSGLQHANLQSALPLLESAARDRSAADGGSVVVVDYGASQGRNSMAPMSLVIDTLSATAGSTRPIQIIHTDLPTNDFATLFSLLANDPTSYLKDRVNIFPSAIGRSYYEQILPEASVDLGWSSNALHWMSHSPIDVPDHGWAIFSRSASARAAVDAVLADDWLRFLHARTAELRPGGRLVCQFMGRGEDSHGFDWMAGHFWACIQELEAEEQLHAGQTLRMTAPSAGRSLAQVAAPFEAGAVPGLTLEHLFLLESPDPYWDAYERTGDAQALGYQWAQMMRAANGPNFFSRLDDDRTVERLLDDLVERLAARVARDPQRSRSHLVVLAIRKS